MDNKNDIPEGAKAKFFGKDSHIELMLLTNQSRNATDAQQNQAAQYLEEILRGKHAWFGGWAMKIRGSRRTTEDLNIIVDARSTAEIWDTLLPYKRITLFYYRSLLEDAPSHFGIFVDAEDGSPVCVDVLVSGRMNTPSLAAPDAVEDIQPPDKLPAADGGPRRVVSLRWQVRQKLAAVSQRRKKTDYDDLAWLCDNHADYIKSWIKEEDERHRRKYFALVEDEQWDDEECIASAKDCMGL